MVLLEFITAVTFILGGNGYHLDRSSDLNEDNKISGIELHLKDSEYRPFAKVFTNSFGNYSKTIGVKYFKCKDGELKLCAGYTSGVVEGYEAEINPLPYIYPSASIVYKNLELEVSCLPVACAYELKLRIDF